MRMPRLAKIGILTGAAALTLAGGGTVANAEGAPESARKDDQAAFDELLRRQEQAWANQDGEAFAATFHEDGDLVAVTGHHLRTREGIAEGMEYFFDNYIEPSTIKTLGEDVRYVEPDVVVIIRESCLINEGETECREGSLSTNTNVMTREHGEWLQASFQNTRQIQLD